MSHTPGPWRLVIENRNSGIAIVDAPKSVKSICRTFEPFSPGDVTENYENARLIAAAPDLLAAAVDVLEAMEWCECGGGKGSGPYQTLRAAIAKAKGEE